MVCLSAMLVRLQYKLYSTVLILGMKGLLQELASCLFPLSAFLRSSSRAPPAMLYPCSHGYK